MKVGYTTGVFDLFHIGHLNLLSRAKNQCDKLIVGVTTDELCQDLKGKLPVIPFEERIQIVEAICYVDEVVAQNKIDEIGDWERLAFNIIFKGSDWKGSEKWRNLEGKFRKLNVEVMFFDYTETTSSTAIRNFIEGEILNDKGSDS